MLPWQHSFRRVPVGESGQLLSILREQCSNRSRLLRGRIVAEAQKLRGYHSQPSSKLTFATYNTQLLPFPVSHDGDRRVVAMARRLPLHLAAVDVLIFNELISPRRRQLLLDAIKPAWPFQSSYPQQLGRVSGGVHVVSRYPIKKETRHVYRATQLFSSDRLAAKGAVHVELDRGAGRTLHVIGTHMHAPDTSGGHRVRLHQLEELHEFIAQLNIPRHEMLFLGGDFNMDLDRTHTQDLLKIRWPQFHGSFQYSVDESTNVLVGYAGSCKRGEGTCKRRLLDGVLQHREYGPVHHHMAAAVVPIRDHKGRDLSDHHAVTLELHSPAH